MNATPATGDIRVSPDAVCLELEAATGVDAIRALGRRMVAAGWVTSRYVDAVVEREARYPTGLPTEPEPIAVPHADPEGVLVPAIAVGRLRRPVDSVEMATAGTVLPVRLVLLLALQSKDQAAVLSTLIRAWQDADLLSFLLTCTSPRAVAERIVDLITPGAPAGRSGDGDSP